MSSVLRDLSGINETSIIAKNSTSDSREPSWKLYVQTHFTAKMYVNTLFFYKNHFYKNVEAGFCLKFKNILRTFPGWESLKNNFYSDQMFLNEQYKYG